MNYSLYIQNNILYVNNRALSTYSFEVWFSDDDAYVSIYKNDTLSWVFQNIKITELFKDKNKTVTYVDRPEVESILVDYISKIGGIGSDVYITDAITGTHAEVNSSKQLKVVLDGKVDINNTSNVPLPALGTFTGTASDTLDYAIFFVSVYTDAPSAINGLQIEMSSDGISWHISDVYDVLPNVEKSFSFQCSRKFFRIKYTNGTIVQTVLDLQTILKKTNSLASSHRIIDNISGNDDAQLIKAVLTAINPVGTFVNAKANIQGNIQVSLQEQKDIFGRLKVSDPVTISDGSLVSAYSNFIFWSQKIINGGTLAHEKATSSNLLSVTNPGDIVINQTKLRNHYQPAKAQEALTTFYAPQEAGVEKYIGYFDVDNYTSPVIDGTIYNGVVLVITESDVEFRIYNNGVLNDSATQSQWNIDKLDGNPLKSGITLDMNFPQISLSELEWLGVGAVVVGLNIGGVSIPVHVFEHANFKGTGVYTRTAKLPICYMIKSVGGAGIIRQICNSVISGGGHNPKGVQRFVGTTTDVAILNGQAELMVGIRLKITDFDTTVLHESISVISRAKNDFFAGLSINPTYTGTVTWIDKPNSSIQYAVNNNNLLTAPGIDLYGEHVSGAINSVSPDFDPTVRIGKGLNNDYDELWVWVRSDDGTDNYSAVINYRELL